MLHALAFVHDNDLRQARGPGLLRVLWVCLGCVWDYFGFVWDSQETHASVRKTPKDTHATEVMVESMVALGAADAGLMQHQERPLMVDG